MKKRVVSLFILGLALAGAGPAKADAEKTEKSPFRLSGYYRMTGVSQNIRSKAVDPATESLIDQRIRMKMTYDLNQDVSFVYYGEVDTVWGEQSKGKIGGGGKLGTDGVNLETKNAYVSLKVPNTKLNLTLGLQGFDDLFQNVVISEDLAGGLLSGELGPVNVDLLYSKFDEGDRDEWDDRDFYALQLTRQFNNYFKAAAAVYLDDANDESGTESESFYYGLLGDYRVGTVGLSGFALLQDGTQKTAGIEADSSALAASVRVARVLAHGDAGLRLIYFSPDDDARDNNAWKAGIGEWEFPRENLMIFLPDVWINNTGTTRYAMTDAAQAGFGLYALTATANLKGLPKGLYAKLGAGAFWAASDERNDTDTSHTSGTLVTDSSDARAGKTLGYEVAAQVGKVFAEKFDLSLRGAYAAFGDFYDDSVTGDSGQVDDPDNVYKVAMMVNVKF